MPEWRYFGEQTRKAEALVRLGAAVQAPVWPGDLSPAEATTMSAAAR
jgi:UDP-N-acetylglucosamine--N-acetylmuramyl-(pentapeptide) pyrophosphoryl-undecaprenol N-acetylglucosamine transferase